MIGRHVGNAPDFPQPLNVLRVGGTGHTADGFQDLIHEKAGGPQIIRHVVYRSIS